MLNCQKYNGLCLFPKQFVTSLAPQNQKQKKLKQKNKLHEIKKQKKFKKTNGKNLTEKIQVFDSQFLTTLDSCKKECKGVV